MQWLVAVWNGSVDLRRSNLVCAVSCEQLIWCKHEGQWYYAIHPAPTPTWHTPLYLLPSTSTPLLSVLPKPTRPCSAPVFRLSPSIRYRCRRPVFQPVKTLLYSYIHMQPLDIPVHTRGSVHFHQPYYSICTLHLSAYTCRHYICLHKGHSQQRLWKCADYLHCNFSRQQQVKPYHHIHLYLCLPCSQWKIQIFQRVPFRSWAVVGL